MPAERSRKHARKPERRKKEDRKTEWNIRSAHCLPAVRPDMLAPYRRLLRNADRGTPGELCRRGWYGLWLQLFSGDSGACFPRWHRPGVDVYVNQLLYTAGLFPLLAFVAMPCGESSPVKSLVAAHRLGLGLPYRSARRPGQHRFLRGAHAAGGKASMVAPVTALFPDVTVLLALLFLHERLGRVQWLGCSGVCRNLSLECVKEAECNTG